MADGFSSFADSDPGDEFSNNLFSDLAPLLALCGEQIAMQFMAESMGWADNIIFAMAPIGVLTTIVGAIRVGGATWLKALIGRAKESTAVAELELMSSTSDEVCEVFNGRHVVRIMGKPSIKELIFMKSISNHSEEEGVEGVKESFLTLSEALDRKALETKDFPDHPFVNQMNQKVRRLVETFVRHVSVPGGKVVASFPYPLRDHRPQAGHAAEQDVECGQGGAVGGQAANFGESCKTKLRSLISSSAVLKRYGGCLAPGLNRLKSFLFPAEPDTNNDKAIKDLSKKPPNISLNMYVSDGREELHFVAAIAIFLQLAVLAFQWLITYNPTFKQQKGGRDMGKYAFPLTCLGTLVVVSGMLLCSYIIESATMDKIHRSQSGMGNLQMLWIQRGGSVGDQVFGSYLMLAREMRDNVITSRRKERDGDSRTPFVGATLTAIGSDVTVAGFVLQFVGLRSMTWLASISQLIAVVIMIILRAYVRRGLSKIPWARKLPKGYEIDWLATRTSEPSDLDRFLNRIKDDSEPTTWSSRGDGVLEKPWGDRRDDGFWEDGSFGWGIRPVGGSKRYGKLRNFKEPADRGGQEDRVPTQERGGNVGSLMGEGQEKKIKSISMRLIETRIQLKSKISWPGPAIEQAVRVASAIETILNSFPPDDPTVKKLVWSIDDDLGVETTFDLELDGSRVWRANLDQIEAFLSLWLFSVSEKELKRAKKAQKSSVTIPSGTTSKANYCLRLLAPMDESTLQCMYWWVGGAFPLVATAEVPDLSIEGVDEFEIGLTTPKGNHGVSIMDGAKSGLESTTQTPISTTFERHRIVGYQEVTDPNTETLVVACNVAIEVLYAQELFSAFMRSFVQFESQIKGSTKLIQPVKEMNESLQLKSIALEHKELKRVVKSISQSGLGSVEEVMLSILPPLIMERRLPDMTAVVTSIRDDGRFEESCKHWKRAGELYLMAHMVAVQSRCMGSQNGVLYQTTCALTEFIRALTLEIEITEMYREQKYHRKGNIKSTRILKLEDIREEIINALNVHVDSSVLTIVGGLYKKQQREEGSSQWISRHERPQSLTPSTTSEIFASEFWTPLHESVVRGIESIFQDDTFEDSADSRDFAGLTPLHYARSGHIAKYLLDAGASPYARAHDGFTPLHSAARNKQESIAALLIHYMSDLNPRDNRGRTPLHWAAYTGSYKVVDLLLKEGADPQLVSENRRNPLHMAACMGHVTTVRYLVESGKVDISIPDSDGRTPLHLAVAGNHCEVISYFSGLEKSWPEDLSGFTAIHLAAFLGYEKAIEAAFKGGRGVRDAFEKMLDVNMTWGTALHVAAECGKMSVVKLIISKAPDSIDLEDSDGETALMRAALHGQGQVVKFLLECGSEVGTLNLLGQSALHLAAAGGADGSPDVIKTLILKNININSKDQNGNTPLLCAALSGNISAVETLIHGPGCSNIEKYAVNKLRQSALHLAAMGKGKDSSHIIGALLLAGIGINSTDVNGCTPFLCAAATGNISAVKALIDVSDNRNAVDGLGRSALHLAVGLEPVPKPLIELLVSSGVDKGLGDKEGKSALDYPIVQKTDWLKEYLAENVSGGRSAGEVSEIRTSCAVQNRRVRISFNEFE